MLAWNAFRDGAYASRVDGFVRDPHLRVAGTLALQPPGDLLWRPTVIKFVSDESRQLHIRRQLAHFRTPRQVERSSIGSERPVRVAATIADNLP